MLLNEIKPQFIGVCTCVGTTEYTANPNTQMPAQYFINRVAPHTDAVYLTSRVINFDDNVFEPFNGNIIFTVRNGNITVEGSSNSDKLLDTRWFQEYRLMPKPYWTPTIKHLEYEIFNLYP
jgi:hypothetical protein